jgi:hypothetical protein
VGQEHGPGWGFFRGEFGMVCFMSRLGLVEKVRRDFALLVFFFGAS